MQDMVEGVATADLVVADLTGRNANVYYELGIAHALRKRAILLAQQASDIPFDLTAYRAIIYSVAISAGPPVAIEETLSGSLVPLLEAIERGEILFASPFSDFAPLDEMEPELPQVGVLDALARLEQDTPKYVQTMTEIGTLTAEAGAGMNKLTAEMKNPPATGVNQFALIIAAKAGSLWDRQAEQLAPLVAERLVPLSLSVEQGMLAEVRAALLGNDTERLERARTMLRELAAISAESSKSALTLAATTRRVSQWASAMQAPGGRLASVLEQIAAQIDRIAALPDAVDRLVEGSE